MAKLSVAGFGCALLSAVAAAVSFRAPVFLRIAVGLALLALGELLVVALVMESK